MLDSLFGSQLGTMAKFAIAFVLVLGLIGITALILRRFGGGMPTSGGGRGRQPRLSVLDSAVVDSKRKLVLVRRDNSEHLLLIGGPTDVVVETNINRAGPATAASRPRGMQQQEIEAIENAAPADDGYEEPTPPPAPTPRAPQPAPRPREAAPRPQLRPQPQPQPELIEDDMPLAPLPEPAAYSPPPPLPPRPIAHPSAAPAAPAAPAPRGEPNYADMQAKMEAALRKPATAPAPRAPEPRAAAPAPQPRPAAPPMPQTRTMPASPAPAVAQPSAPMPQRQDAPNPFDSLEAEMASLLGQDKKR